MKNQWVLHGGKWHYVKQGRVTWCGRDVSSKLIAFTLQEAPPAGEQCKGCMRSWRKVYG